ncbi:MAG TPA: hypothetical protein VHF23_05590 [Gaiellaceae bacterium]|nr:hypothetical protein [Gaiellaceae bacterium]
MATILEIARFAGVSSEDVLRVVHGEPVREDVARQVRDAMDALGPPPYPRTSAEVLPAEQPRPLDRRQDELLERMAAAAAELEARLPEGVGSVVYEALRVEVRPVAEHVAEIGSLFERLLRRLDLVGTDVESERRERVEDVALLTELITAGWRGVDRRLARLERIIARLEEREGGRPAGRVIRLDDHQSRTSPE